MTVSIALSDKDVLRHDVSTSAGTTLSHRDLVSPWEEGVTSRTRADLEWAVERQLFPLQELPTGWDSYGAPAIDGRVVSLVVKFLVDVLAQGLPKPWVVPTSLGGISLEWRRDQKELTVEWSPQRSLVDAFFSDDEAGYEWDLPFPAEGLFLPALASMER